MRRDLQGPLKIVACIMKEYLAGTRRSADFLDWQAESQALLNAWESSVIPDSSKGQYVENDSSFRTWF